MITNIAGNTVISHLGWVDKDGIWLYQSDQKQLTYCKLGDADFCSPHKGKSDFFSIFHHSNSGKNAKISLHHFDSPKKQIAAISIDDQEAKFIGEIESWNKVPALYTFYFKGDFRLLQILPSDRQAKIIDLDWYNEDYDKGYQGIVGVLEIPESRLCIISVQRDSSPILFDLDSMSKVGSIKLADRHGNPVLTFREGKNELWADDYDTLLKINPGDWSAVKKSRLQNADERTMKFIGHYAFSFDNSLCLVARPFSSDIIAIDPDSFETLYVCRTGKQPLVVAQLSDSRIIVRDWKSGDWLSGELEKI